MNKITLFNSISKLIEKIDYKSVYIEIKTETDTYTLERNKRKKIGFDIRGRESKK